MRTRRVVLMLFEVDFALRINDNFLTIHKAFVLADSVSECQKKAEGIRNELPQNKLHQVHIFIEA
ncbi:hypothetical protein G4Z05_00585 [Bacillus thermocopriae]|uniref:Uncharacterized protein n=1 Tax=Neobacillus thermocopriae TaxID=1215031 RepID=A0A6B3TNN7_9BACI|nr:hypothetical protein [Neobacillus thermocopriae]NEX77397.1 hypothetical protein [Neobacillus thermocopriae]